MGISSSVGFRNGKSNLGKFFFPQPFIAHWFIPILGVIGEMHSKVEVEGGREDFIIQSVGGAWLRLEGCWPSVGRFNGFGLRL